MTIHLGFVQRRAVRAVRGERHPKGDATWLHKPILCRIKEKRIAQLAILFFKLGTTAFGGPAAHIAMMEEEVVRRRQWMTKERFLDLVGATNLIPGPNSTEMAIHIGYMRAGVAGLIVAGLSFIIPAVVITGALAWMYVKFGTLPEISPFFFGLKPVVVSIILVAGIRMGKTAAKSGQLVIIGVSVAAAALAGLNEVLALLCGGAAGIMLYALKESKGKKLFLWGISFLTPLWVMFRRGDVQAAVAAAAVGAAGVAGISLWKLGLFFLKIGAVLYGSGYVLIAFLEGGLVKDYGWLTQQQLLDAVAVGQFTPGPVLSTATFVGYVISGAPGASSSYMCHLPPVLLLCFAA